MRRMMLACGLAMLPAAAHANDWEKFFQPSPVGSVPILPAARPPETVALSGDIMASMWRRGFALIGFSEFNSPNASTKDALRFAEKLHAAYVAVGTDLQSSRTLSLPQTTPTTVASYTNGQVSATGPGGFASGSYSGTTTTVGSRTTYVPVTLSRFDKVAAYFGELAKQGPGMLFRAPTPAEIASYETRHVLVVRSVRDGSPADVANVLEGDAVLTINGSGATIDALHSAVASRGPISLHLLRNGQGRDVTLPPAQ